MVSDLVMVTAPKPPGSRTEISPPAAVFEMAPAQVLHGAVRLHGLTSSPTPDTQVRDACACAGAAQSSGIAIAPTTVRDRMTDLSIEGPPCKVVAFLSGLEDDRAGNSIVR